MFLFHAISTKTSMRFAAVLFAVMAIAIPATSHAQSLRIDSSSTQFISLTQQQPYTTTIAIFGDGLGYLYNKGVTVELGPFTATSVLGNSQGMNVQFLLDTAQTEKRKKKYPIIIKQDGREVYRTGFTVKLVDFYKGQDKYKRTRPRRYLKNTLRNGRANKRQVGLNVHMALGSDASLDATYMKKLRKSNTIWVREHISFKLLMGENQAAWLTRYDKVMLKYAKRGMRVVGMLAYGAEGSEHEPPNTQEWAEFVELVTMRYRNMVDAWEIWNEPDSPDYLVPNKWRAYKPLLVTASPIIRRNDPESIVLPGAISDIRDKDFTKKLYRHGIEYFDALNVHLYYCDEYRDDGESLERMKQDWEKYYALVNSFRENEKVWFTELGCSTGLPGVGNGMAKRYNKAATNYLRKLPYAQPVLLYTFRDRPFLEPYEANFGIMSVDLKNKATMRWYRKLQTEITP